MKKLIYIILFALMLSSTLFAQSPVIIWTNRYDGGGNDKAQALSLDNQNNIYVAGRSTNNTSERDMFLLKLNSSGIMQWTNRFDLLGLNNCDDADDVYVAPSGSIYQVGYSSDFATYYWGITREFDSTGAVIWETNYLNSTEFHSIAVDNAGNQYIAGVYSSGADWQGLIMKRDSNNDMAWTNSYNYNTNSDDFRRVAIDPTGTYLYTCGSRHKSGIDYDLVLVRYNAATGQAVWTNIYNTVGTGFENGTAVVCDNSGNVYVTGMYYTGSWIVIQTIKYNASGILQWSRNFIVAGNNTAGHGIALDSGGNVYVVGDIGNVNYGWLIMKYNSAGSNIWVKTRMGTGDNQLRDIAVIGNGDGEIFVTGGDNNGSDQDFFTAMYRQVPFSPSGLGATAISTNTIKLTWGDNSSSENNFNIYRSTDGTNFVVIDSVGAGITSYSDTSCALDTPYWYKVAATNEAGRSILPSNTVNKTITPPADGGIVIEQDGEKDVIIGRNKIYTSKKEIVYFYFRKKAEVVIYSIDGREIERFNASANTQKEWGEEDTVPGVYIASITIDGRDDIVVRKILVLR